MIKTASRKKADDERVYLFSSGRRDIYLTDIYNTLAYPPGFVVQFRYRNPWIGPKIKSRAWEHLEGKEAVVVASPENPSSQGQPTQAETKYNFYPLRKGEILKSEFRGDALHIYCRFSCQIPKYSATSVSNLEKEITKLGSYPKFSNDEEEDVFVAISENPQIKFTESSEDELNQWNQVEDEWVEIITTLGEHPMFEKTLFYRISDIVELSYSKLNNIFAYISSGTYWFERQLSKVPLSSKSAKHRVNRRSRCPSVTSIRGPIDMGYVMDSSGQYQVDLLLTYAGKPPENAAKNYLRIKPGKSMSTSIASLKLGFRTDTEKITLSPESARTGIYSDLSISPERGGVECPEVNFPLYIRTNYWRKYGVYILIFLGLFLSTVANPLTAGLYNLPFSLLTITKTSVQSFFVGLGFVIVAFGLQLYSAK